jgi:putative transposase
MYTHLQFTVKYRRKVINPVIANTVRDSFKDICSKLKIRLVAFGCADDHTHCVIEHPDILPIGIIVGRLKGAASRRVRQLFPELTQVHASHFWTPSYHSKPCDDYLARAAAYDARHPLAGKWWK